MKMGYKNVSIGILVAVSAMNIAIADDRRNDDRKLRETQVSYILRHKGGVSERVLVRYEAFLGTRVWQTGSSSKPFEGHLSDDRQCHIDLNARVYRRAYILSISGVQAPVEEYQAVYAANSGKSRGADSTLEGLTYHRTCGDVNNFQETIGAAGSGMIGQFDALVAQDDDRARERLRAMLKGDSIEKE